MYKNGRAEGVNQEPIAHTGKFPLSCELVLGHSYPVFPHTKNRKSDTGYESAQIGFDNIPA